MANTSQPYRRTGSNSWQELIDKVNEELENPPEDTDCEPIEPIELPDPPHRWAKSDIREVHDKLDEMPGNCFSWEAIPELWKLSIITEIEDQLGEAWCDCEEECIPDCSNAQESSYENIDSITTGECHACGVCGQPSTCDDWYDDGFADIADQADAAGGEAHSAKYDWAIAFVKVCQLDDEIEELEKEIEKLEDQIQALEDAKAACKAACDPDDAGCPGACDATYDPQIDAKEAELEEKETELEEKEAERDEEISKRDEAMSEMDAKAGESEGLATSLCGYDSCSGCLVPTGDNEPCADVEDCDDIGSCYFSPLRCCVGWVVQIKSTKLAKFYWEGSWATRIGGMFTVSGQPYYSNVTFAPCLPAYACYSCGPGGGCNYGCSGSVYLYEARKRISYPRPSGEWCCSPSGGGE